MKNSDHKELGMAAMKLGMQIGSEDLAAAGIVAVAGGEILDKLETEEHKLKTAKHGKVYRSYLYGGGR